MIVIGHQDIPYEDVSFIKTIDQIKETRHATLFFDYDIELAKHLHDNSIEYGCVIESIEQAIILANLTAKYIVVEDEDFARSIQDIANHYMFDTKILVKVKSSSELEWTAVNKIDGVILWDKLF